MFRADHIYKADHPYLQRFLRTDCFENVKERFERTANANYEKTTRIHEPSNENGQITILASVVENPNISVRQVSDEIGVSKSLVSKLLKKNKFHPYHVEYHQSLSDLDFQNRLQFCDWTLIKTQEDPNFFLIFYSRMSHHFRIPAEPIDTIFTITLIKTPGYCERKIISTVLK